MKMTIKRSLRAVLGALALLCALTPARASATQLMTYQGRLKESGLPVSGTKSVAIVFCNCLSGLCAPACTSSGAQGVAVSSGLFRTTFTVPVGVDLAVGTWFLEVVVGGFPMSPREQLTASPYAVQASSAAGLAAAPGAAGVSVSSHLFVVNSRLGVGTVLPQSELHVFTSLAGGGLRLEGGVTNPTLTLAQGSIKRGQLSYSNGNDFLSLTGSKAFIIKGPGDGSIELGTGDFDAFTGGVHMIVSSNTRVGVGTLSPAARLHVSSSNALASENIFLISSGTAAGQDLLVVKGGGNIGIGTTSPTRKIQLQTPINNYGYSHTDGAISLATFLNGAFNSGMIGTESAHPFQIYTANSGPVATFTSGGDTTGRVGIRTATPDQILTVAGNMSQTGVLISSGTGNNYFAGNVGIATTAPGSKLDIFQPNQTLPNIQTTLGANNLLIQSTYGAGAVFWPGLVWYTSDNNPTKPKAGVWAYGDGAGTKMQFGTSNSFVAGINNTAMTIDGNGSVGIGTTGPTAKLHVLGPSIFEGDVAITTGSASGGSHLRSTQPTSPTGAASTPGCGTGPTAAITGTDMAGGIQLNSGPAPGGACMVTVTFVRPYATAPKAVVISPMGPLAGTLNAFIQIAPTTGGFVLQSGNAVSPTTQYNWSYIVIE